MEGAAMGSAGVMPGHVRPVRRGTQEPQGRPYGELGLCVPRRYVPMGAAMMVPCGFHDVPARVRSGKRRPRPDGEG